MEFHTSAARGQIWLSILLLLLSGCSAVRPAAELKDPRSGRPDRVHLQDIPVYPQEDKRCGAAALAMALSWSGKPLRPQEIAAQVYNPVREGSLQASLLAAARRQERLAYTFRGLPRLVREVAAGHPAIVLRNLGLSWWPVYHYGLVVGYDLNKGLIRLHDGGESPESVAWEVFQRTWARAGSWGLLVLAPGDVPATADRDEYLRSVLGLEQAGQYEAAIKGYRAALQRWPENAAAFLGLGNCYYALQELEAAEAILRRAVALHPKSAPLRNNLAQVLFEQGEGDAALQEAKKAVSCGAQGYKAYQETLREIEAGRSGKE